MKIAALAAVLGVATVAATGCDREPTSRTAYNNSGASAMATAPDQVPPPAAPQIAPPPQGLAIPSHVPADATQPAAPTVVPATPDTASPAVPPTAANAASGAAR